MQLERWQKNILDKDSGLAMDEGAYKEIAAKANLSVDVVGACVR